MTEPETVEVITSALDVVKCGACEQPLGDAELVPVGDGYWHERCALLHVVGSLAELRQPPRALLTPQQVADQLGESRDSVLRRKEAIGYVRLRRDGVADENAPVRFRQEDVDRYIAANLELPVEDDETLNRVRRRPRPAVVEKNPHLLPRRHRQQRSAS